MSISSNVSRQSTVKPGEAIINFLFLYVLCLTSFNISIKYGLIHSALPSLD